MPTADQAAHVLELGPQAIARGIATRLARLPGDAAGSCGLQRSLGDRTELPLAAALADLEPKAALRRRAHSSKPTSFSHENPLEFIHPSSARAVLEDDER